MIYACQGSALLADHTALTIISTANGRPRIIEYKLSNVGLVTTDSQFQVTARRFTNPGTATIITPSSTDPSNPAPTLFTAGTTSDVEPTYGGASPIDNTGVNPRGLYRWTAYDPRAEIILPAVANNGVGFLVDVIGGATVVIVDAKVMQ